MGKINVLEMIEELRNEALSSYPGEEEIAKLAIIQVGDEPASNLYVKSKKTEMAKWRIGVIHHKLPEDVGLYALVRVIEECNMDANIHGIIVQLPLPPHLKFKEEYILSLIYPKKNVDGFKQVGKPKYFDACTPAGIVWLMKKLRGDLTGKEIVIIGRGKTVGDPLIDLLRNEPYSRLILCNSHTTRNDLETAVYCADIIVTAVGKPGLFDSEFVCGGSLVIDAGISYVNGVQTGDYSHTDSDEFYEPDEQIDYTPHRGGVGKVTVAFLGLNTIKAMELQK